MFIPWYTVAWIPGTLFGVAVGILGGLIGSGKLRRGALELWLAMTAVAALFSFIGATALILGQPYGVWYSFLLPGLIGLAALGVNLPAVVRRVREQSSAGA